MKAWLGFCALLGGGSVLAAWLRYQGIRDFNARTLERLVVAAKTAKPGKTFDVLHGRVLKIGGDHLALATADR